MTEFNVECHCGEDMRRGRYTRRTTEYVCPGGHGIIVRHTSDVSEYVKCPVIVNGARCANKITFLGDFPEPCCRSCRERVVRFALQRKDERKEILEHLGSGAVTREKARQWKEWRDDERFRILYEREARAAARKAVEHAVVYYVRLGVNHVKIGTTGHLKERMVALRVANPQNLLAVEPGSYDVESERHREFAKHKYDRRKEDFEEAPALMEHIERVREAYGDPWEYAASQVAEEGPETLLSA